MSGMKKQLGLLGVFSLASGAMISSGLFVLPGLAFAKAGPAVVFSYLIAGLLVVPVLLSQAELGSAMPRSGGSYFFVERSLGPLMGTVAGIANWLSLMLKAGFALIGIGALGTLIMPDSVWVVKVIAVLACVLFTFLNLVSVKGAGWFQNLLVVGLLGILAGYLVMGFGGIEVSRFEPFAPFGVNRVFVVAGMVFVSFGGLNKVVDVAEEVRNPGRNLPLGLAIAFVVVLLLYIAVVAVTVGIVPADELAGSLAPIALGAEKIMGRGGLWLLSAAAFMAFATTANAGILAASRTPLAMSRDGLVPAVLSRTSKRFGTPVVSLLVTSGIMILVISALSIEDLVKTASTMILLVFVLINFSAVVMRYSGLQNYRPSFRSPLNPFLQIGAIVICGFLIADMGAMPLLITGGFALAATLWYLVYVQRQIDRESAIIYFVKNVVSRHISRSNLEEELKQIAIERDEIMLDRFDRLIMECPILDIKEKIEPRDFFKRCAERLAERVGVESMVLYDLFIDRERESTTVIKPGLAIPHIVVPGRGRFEILLVRCGEGVVFSELHEPVRTAFVLVGSQDERNYHLRALMAIAHVVSEDGFEKRWFDARSEEQMRDIVLLSGRKRDK